MYYIKQKPFAHPIQDNIVIAPLTPRRVVADVEPPPELVVELVLVAFHALHSLRLVAPARPGIKDK